MKKYLLILCLIFCQFIKAQEQPNIIFILIDDQRYDFLSFLDHPWIETPNIDALAKRGMYFSNAFVTTSLCSPSRASILTGQYAHTHGVADNDTPLPSNTPTFPQELQKVGYQTAFFGKWHMGGDNDMPRKGFDHWASFRGQGPYFDPVMNIDGKRIPHQGYTPDILTDLAVAYIKKHENDKQPYCLYLSHKSVHENFAPAPQHKGHYKDQKIPKPAPSNESTYKGKPDWLKRQRISWHGSERKFGAEDAGNYGSYDRFFQLYSECMLGVDESVGRISQILKEQGKLENTVIIYFSDNGYMMGEHGLIDKRVMYEESIRVPAFVHWPNKIKKPSVNDEFILNIDIGPTILDIAGAKTPNTMHGESFLRMLDNNTIEWRKDFIYEYFVDPAAVQTPTIFGLRTKEYSYMTYHGIWDIYELYDMKADQRQKNNLLGQVQYGMNYGNFLKFVERQATEIYPTVARLDNRLDELLVQFNGSRKARWTD